MLVKIELPGEFDLRNALAITQSRNAMLLARIAFLEAQAFIREQLVERLRRRSPN